MNPAEPRRIFLDAGVIIDGCFGRWGAAKAMLVLTTLHARFTVVLAEVIDREVRRALVRRARSATPEDAQEALSAFLGWLGHVRLERWPAPSVASVQRALPLLLPVLRHRNDLEAVISAMEARPDRVISSNDAHWGPALAAHTGLRIATPLAFLDSRLLVQLARSS